MKIRTILKPLFCTEGISYFNKYIINEINGMRKMQEIMMKDHKIDNIRITRKLEKIKLINEVNFASILNDVI